MHEQRLAVNIREAGAPAIAADEVDKILALDPEPPQGAHHCARCRHSMSNASRTRRPISAVVLEHPDLIDCLGEYPTYLLILDDAAERLARHGRVAEALRIVDRMISCSLQLNQPRGRAHYAKAVVLGDGRPIGSGADSSRGRATEVCPPGSTSVSWNGIAGTRSSIPSGPGWTRSSICCPTRPCGPERARPAGEVCPTRGGTARGMAPGRQSRGLRLPVSSFAIPQLEQA